MTRDEARSLRELFGPCTTVYECETAEELVEDHVNEAPAAAAWFEYDLESVRLDREMDACDSDADVAELSGFLKELEAKVRKTYGPRPKETV